MSRPNIAKLSDVTLILSRDADLGSYGISRKPVPTMASIVEQLKHAGIVNSIGGLQLIVLPRNPLRLDYTTRLDLRVARGGRPICYLSIGRNLADLRSRTTAFAKACPEIACRPLFWRRVDGWDYFATEYFEGEKLDAELLNGRLSAAQAEKSLNYVVEMLDRTTHASTTAAIERELHQVFAQAAALPVFGDLDRVLLEGIIFSYVRTGALSALPRTRWTNGDFVPQNLLVAASGEVRLVDYEFAARTHFFSADGWRWNRFSKLPPDLRVPSVFVDKRPAGRWFEALCLLQNMVLLHQVHPASVALDESRLCARELVDLIASAHSGFRAEALLRFLAASAQAPVPAATPRSPKAQLFWSSAGDYDETRSQSVAYSAADEGIIRFDIRGAQGPLRLRFDPVNCPGLLEISAIRVRHVQQNETLLSLNEGTGWDDLRLVSDLLRLPDSPFLNLLSLGDDPILEFPEVKISAPTGMISVEVWMRFSSELRRLQLMLSPLLLQSNVVKLTAPDPGGTDWPGRLAECQQQLADRIAQCEQIQAALAMATVKLDTLTEEQGRLEAAHATVRMQADQWSAENVRRAGRITSLETEIISLRQQLEGALASSSSSSEKLSTLTEGHARLEATHVAAKTQVADLSANAAQGVERVAAMEGEMAALRQQLESARQAAITMEATAAGKYDALDQERVRWETAHIAAKTELEQLTMVAARDAERTGLLETEVSNLQRQLEGMRESVISTERVSAEKFTRATEQVQQLQQELAVLRKQDVARQAAADDALIQANREQQRLVARLKETEEAQRLASQAETKASGRLDLLAKHTTMLEGQHAAAALRAEVTMAQLEEARRINAELAGNLTQLRGEQELTSHENHVLRDRIFVLEQELSANEAKVAAREQATEQSRLEFQTQIYSLRQNLEAAETERAYLAGRCKRMSQSFSWRSTAPLRWLRRHVVDPVEGRKT